MSGNSLNQYQKNTLPFTNAGSPSNNFNRNHEATYKPYFRHANSPSVFMPWNSKDPITNFGYCYNNNNCSQNTGANIANIFAAITGGLGILGTVGSIVSIFAGNKNTQETTGFTRKETKEINKNTEDTTLATDAIDTNIANAQNLGEDASFDTLTKTAENLRTSITNANNAKSAALRKASSADATKKLYEDKKKSTAGELGTAKNELFNLEGELKNLESTDTSNMTDEQKRAHYQKIADTKKDIQEKNQQIKNYEKQIEDYDKKIAVQEQIINENNAIAEALNEKISTASQLMEEINIKVNNKDK